ncbi:unnamed protein product [Callosobruchus maculatus]|uniref:Uncharacterized protein n=1 Tax=Callosobruchus maculatus TaxID=64391 RepID=A0A653DKG2_CALMS|nr:unnamed protein product [Callosobruchus maculatus]
MRAGIILSALLVVLTARSESSVLGVGSDIDDIIQKLVDNIPKKIINHGGSFEVPSNKYIQGKVNIAESMTTGLNDVLVNLLTYDPKLKLVQLMARFPKVVHKGVYHNNVTLSKSHKQVEDTTSVMAVLSAVSVSIRCNIDKRHVWKLEANTTVEVGNNGQISTPLTNDDKFLPGPNSVGIGRYSSTR